MRSRTPHPLIRRLARMLLAASALVCAVAASLGCAEQLRSQVALEQLAERVHQKPAVDWEQLLAQNEEAVAWITVDGTTIDHPVAQPRTPARSTWYLRHDFWGAPSPTGCPYLDMRADADGLHALVFGHHVGSSNAMFSALGACHQQKRFDRLGMAHWSTPAGGGTSLNPLCALNVDKRYERIQRFTFDDVEALRVWLHDIARSASARAPAWETLAAEARRVLTLVTCTSDWGGRTERTLVLFAA